MELIGKRRVVVSELSREDLEVLRGCAVAWGEILRRASVLAEAVVYAPRAPTADQVRCAIGAVDRALGNPR